MKMEDDLSLFCKTRMITSRRRKTTSKQIKMEDDLKQKNGSQPQKKEDNLKTKMEENIKKMEDEPINQNQPYWL